MQISIFKAMPADVVLHSSKLMVSNVIFKATHFNEKCVPQAGSGFNRTLYANNMRFFF